MTQESKEREKPHRHSGENSIHYATFQGRTGRLAHFSKRQGNGLVDYSTLTGCPHRFRRDDGTKIRPVNDMFCHGTCVVEIVLLSPARAHFAKFMFHDRQLRPNTRRNLCGQGISFVLALTGESGRRRGGSDLPPSLPCCAG